MRKTQTLPKTERLHSRKLINDLFKGGGSRAMTSFPLRMVYKAGDGLETSQMLVSVPKHNLHRANKRNRVKRQVREAYRKQKELIAGLGMTVAFIWLDQSLHPSEEVEQSVRSLLERAAEKVKGNKAV